MLVITITFPAGRYHATPWGRHVNEADVAWPPDPWRLCRALIAVWHRKLDLIEYPRERLESLLAKLSSEPPRYRLPPAVHAHTRHYMPIRAGKMEKTTLVLDAFARFDVQTPLIVCWSDLELKNEETALLDTLLSVLGYLGRAESWIEAERLTDWQGETNCCPGEATVDADTGEITGETVQLLSPLTPLEYAEFRSRMLEGLEKRTDLKTSERKKIAATLPEDWLAALSLDTSELQAAGWSSPPAARRFSYTRPFNALASGVPAKLRVRSFALSNTVRFALYGKPLPRIEDAVRVGEWLRTAVMSTSKRILGEDALPAILSGHGLLEDNCHGHAFFLPEDADNDGRIDHLLIHAPDGFGPETVQAFACLDRLRNREGQEWDLLLEILGPVEGITGSKLMGAARIWESRTPYLHPWHVKKKFSVEDQLLRECRLRGLPEPHVEHLEGIRVGGCDRRPIQFHRFRSKRGLSQPDRHGSFWRLTFAEPIPGPLALGFGCHFGLGLFEPSK